MSNDPDARERLLAARHDAWLVWQAATIIDDRPALRAAYREACNALRQYDADHAGPTEQGEGPE